MKLVSFSVTNYRSIVAAHKLPISDTTILIGPNNEGKSNILNALTTAIGLIRVHEGGLRGMYNRKLYDWGRDFPISLQESKPNGETIFRVNFLLDTTEITSFRTEVGSSIDGNLPVEIRISHGLEPVFKVLKRGPGGQALSKKGRIVAQFIGKRFHFTYIPAIRTAEQTMEVVSDLLADALRGIESVPKYKEAVRSVAAVQQPVLNELSEKITIALREFIPQVRKVEIRISASARFRALRHSCEIIIDDGTPTDIEQKGDGVKSLAAISLLRGLKQTSRASLLALEEPESHLHPGAIHLLKGVIEDLAKSRQVVLTTHCPLFVDRINVAQNIIVTSNKAKPAKRISDIREILGIKASDNLIHANFVLVVEGEDDKIALQALLSFQSNVIRTAIRTGALVIEPIAGAGNLPYKLSLLHSALCATHTFLDNDEAGRHAAKSATDDGILPVADYTMAICDGMTNSELEDVYDASAYRDFILDKYNVDINMPRFRGNRKWSERMGDTFGASGQQWNEGICHAVKSKLAGWVADNPGRALHAVKRTSVDALTAKIERALNPQN